MRAIAVLFAIALAACATKPPAPLPLPEPVVVTRTVTVPVRQACVPATFEKSPPAYPDSKAAVTGAPDVRERAKLVSEANVLLHSRVDQLEAVVNGCE